MKRNGSLHGVFGQVFFYMLVSVSVPLTFAPVAIIGLQGFFPLKGQAATGVGSIEYPISERKRLAQL